MHIVDGFHFIKLMIFTFISLRLTHTNITSLQESIHSRLIDLCVVGEVEDGSQIEIQRYLNVAFVRKVGAFVTNSSCTCCTLTRILSQQQYLHCTKLIGADSDILEVSGIKMEPSVNQPLPKPFPLPQNYPADVEADLVRGSMSCTTTAKFMTTFAHAVFAMKRYPTRLDYTTVACQIIKKYPFLKSPVGLGYLVQFMVCVCTLSC